MTDPQRDFAMDVVRRLREAGHLALWAGGCVRDLLLQHVPEDYDVATNARPERVREVFGPRRTLAIGEAFGVILVKGPRGVGDVEVATFRSEGPYLDGRRPESVVFCTPEEDAHRRDFTINGMFYDPLAEQVFDYVDGQADLQRKVVRAIGDPRARFAEDKLRMLRAVRMTAKFDFTLDPATADAIRERPEDILVVSQERIAQELRKMLVHPRRARAMALAAEVDILRVILPELAAAELAARDESPGRDALLRRLELLEQPSFELCMAVLLGDSVRALGVGADDRSLPDRVETCTRRLRLSNKEREGILWLVSNRESLSEAAHLPLRRLKRLAVQPLIRELIALSRVDAIVAAREPDDAAFTEQFLATTPPEVLVPPALLTGDDLKAAGFKPGPDYKRLLDAVRDAQLEGHIGTFEEALALAERLRSLSN